MSYLENMQGKIKNTSLTKHGAHKIKKLLEKYGSRNVLENLQDPVESINIDLPQARKNLSAYDGYVPEFWDEAVNAGDEVLRGLVLMAIILSHSELVKGMKMAGAGGYKGVVIRKGGNEDKVFTNLRNNIESLGFATDVEYGHVSYDFSSLFSNDFFRAPLRELVRLKIVNARESQSFDYLEAVQEEEIGEIFGSDNETFVRWFFPEEDLVKISSKHAEEMGAIREEEGGYQIFEFNPGHHERSINSILVSRKVLDHEMNVLHNRLQNKLYDELVGEFGEGNVGTEQRASGNTYIDAMVRTEEYCFLYEIKTASTAKLCIRQALSQLLEYAYWGEYFDKIDKLVVVATAPETKASNDYLCKLREKHGIPIYYRQLIF